MVPGRAAAPAGVDCRGDGGRGGRVVAGVGAQRWYDRGPSVLVPAVPRPEPWVVDRPGEVGQVVAALRRRAGTVGITTAVAKMVRADRRVLRRFGAGCTG